MSSLIGRSKVQALTSAVRRDDGMALATVAAISMVLFLLATTLTMLATQQQVEASNQAQRTKALNAADAGIDAYIYRESIQDAPGSLSGDTADASWTVTASTPLAGSTVTTLTSVGTIPAVGNTPAATRTIVATLRLASFSDYMFLFNNYIRLGAGGVVDGNVRSNSWVQNDGEIMGYTYAASYITGSGIFHKYPLHPYYATQSFAVVDYGSLMATAQADGTYFPDSGAFADSGQWRHYYGYCLSINGMGGTVTKVKSIDTVTGQMVTDSSTTQSFSIPANGVLYFDDPVWVGGTYSAKVTIVCGKDIEEPGTNPTYGRMAPGPSGMNPRTPSGSTNNANSSVYLWKNLVSADPNNPEYVCGIVTRGDISITSEYPDSVTPTNLTIQSAMLSTEGSIHADWTWGCVKDYLKILGAEAMWDQGFIKATSGGTTVMGFEDRDYFYDPNLNVTTPPNFPTLGDGTIHVQSWVEQ